ncbi:MULTISPECIES: HEAT repeat domain-containing protein [unclassified Streptomyces]|uniref:HEAT repeat domain-containing protein n=1 Tax=unclassified Streptomyces TaxID=2593676 RepID=UPI002E1375DF|nr:HEAT repeat domain-containing protein [Streptomyces sp. NBC_01197]WSS53141.1 HEAT repeat domain-containing protein [Streptomyces sp. NBC_01180]
MRNAAALEIGKQREIECGNSLVDALWREPDFFVRETMTWAVTRLKEATRPAVLAAITVDQSPEVRVQACTSSASSPTPRRQTPFCPISRTRTSWSHARPAGRSAASGSPGRSPHLIALLGDQVREEERNALTDDVAAFGSAAVPALVCALGSDDRVVRRHAADILCYIGHPDAEDAAEALGAAVEDPESLVAVAALMALGELHGDVARQMVETAREAEDGKIKGIAERLAVKQRRAALRSRRTGSVMEGRVTGREFRSPVSVA